MGDSRVDHRTHPAPGQGAPASAANRAERRNHRSQKPNDLAEWKEFGEAFFGKVPMASGTHAKNDYEMLEWFMEVYKDLPREQMIANFAPKK